MASSGPRIARWSSKVSTSCLSVFLPDSSFIASMCSAEAPVTTRYGELYNVGALRVRFPRHVAGRLLVQPALRQPTFPRDLPDRVDGCRVAAVDSCVDVVGGPIAPVGERHRRASDDVHAGPHSSSPQPLDRSSSSSVRCRRSRDPCTVLTASCVQVSRIGQCAVPYERCRRVEYCVPANPPALSARPTADRDVAPALRASRAATGRAAPPDVPRLRPAVRPSACRSGAADWRGRRPARRATGHGIAGEDRAVWRARCRRHSTWSLMASVYSVRDSGGLDIAT